MPEIIKSGIINNIQILRLLKNDKERFLSRDYKFLKKIISKTLMTKIKFLDDVYENSQRLNLNFGHTFAHAIEMTFKSNKGYFKTRRGIGMGMMCEIFCEGYGKILD